MSCVIAVGLVWGQSDARAQQGTAQVPAPGAAPARLCGPDRRAGGRDRGPQGHDGAARASRRCGPARAATSRRRITPTTTRRSANPYPESARRADAEERQEGHDRRRCGGSSGGRRSSRTSSAKCSAACRRDVPKVTWTVTATVDGDGRRPPRRSASSSIGHVDNIGVSRDHRRHPDDARHAGRRQGPGAGDDDVRRRPACPAIRRRPAEAAAWSGGLTATGRASDPPATEQLIAAGWGYASLNPASIQADNGAGLTKRHHRAGQQGRSPQAGRLGLAARVGVGRVARARLPRDRHDGRRQEGRHRRRLALRQGRAGHDGVRHAVRGRAGRLVGRRRRQAASPQLRRSGREPHRLGEYHWMAGNFLKYGAAEATFGSKNAGDIPVDAHQLIALCAPRPTFISYGMPEKGDAKWLDQQGSFMAAVAAGRCSACSARRTSGRSDDYKTEKMPAVNVEPARRPARVAAARRRPHRRPELEVLHPVGGQVRSRSRALPAQHRAAACARRAPGRSSPRRARITNSMAAHAQLLEKAQQGGIDVYFIGDSITRRWGATDYPELLANWKQNFFGWNAGRLRLGRRQDAEHPLAARERRARRRQPEGDRDPRRHEQRRSRAGRRGEDRRHHARADAIVDVCRQKAPQAPRSS